VLAVLGESVTDALFGRMVIGRVEQLIQMVLQVVHGLPVLVLADVVTQLVQCDGCPEEATHLVKEGAAWSQLQSLLDCLEMMGAALALAAGMRVIAGQAVGDKDTLVVVAKRSANDFAAAVADDVERRCRVGEVPQPGALSVQPPTGLVGVDCWALAQDR